MNSRRKWRASYGIKKVLRNARAHPRRLQSPDDRWSYTWHHDTISFDGYCAKGQDGWQRPPQQDWRTCQDKFTITKQSRKFISLRVLPPFQGAARRFSTMKSERTPEKTAWIHRFKFNFDVAPPVVWTRNNQFNDRPSGQNWNSGRNDNHNRAYNHERGDNRRDNGGNRGSYNSNSSNRSSFATKRIVDYDLMDRIDPQNQ